MGKKSRKFKTEVRQLLDLVIHSLYSKKEIFLRELISNASDAIDRLQFEALTDKALLKDGAEWKIRIAADKDARTITISDNGIGMTAAEVESNIGTIANSGTQRFLDELRKTPEGGAAELIGQFGVGFYASFMVAEKVTLITRRAGSEEPAVKWTSAGDETYTLEDAERDGHGTDVTLHLREGMETYCEEYELRRIIREYSDYIRHPIVMDVTRTKKAEKEGEADETTVEEQTLNSRKAIWKKSPGELKTEDYNDFYKHVSHDYHDPMRVIHYRAEGATEFQALLFVPAQAPFDLYWPDAKRGLHLYVKNVFITDNCETLLPPYLRFVKGVVDSSDLPLNVSREMLQDDALIRRINKSLVGRILKELEDVKTRTPEEYLTFYGQFGRVLKEGINADAEHYDRLTELVMFMSSASEDGKPVFLRQYVERMPEGQKDIYYLSAESVAQAAHAPHLEVFRKKGYEVLFLVDPIDEWVVQRLSEYDGKKLKAIDRGDIDLAEGEDAETEKAAREEAEAKFKPLLESVRKSLDEDVKEVRLSSRLTDSAACLVADEYGMNANMERIMKALNQEVPAVKRVLELNPEHPIVTGMLALLEKDAENAKLADYAHLLHDQALLAEGSPLKDPSRYLRLIDSLMVAGL